MQSLALGLEIESLIIDAFVSVLNKEESNNKSGKDKRRYYFTTDAMVNIFKFQK